MRRGRDSRESARDSAGVVPVHDDDDDITVAVSMVCTRAADLAPRLLDGGGKL